MHGRGFVCKLRRYVLAVAAAWSFFSSPIAVGQQGNAYAPGRPPGTNDLELARQDMAEENYNRAIARFRRYLQKNRNHFDVWSQLAAAIYHTGLPRKALTYLRSVEDRVQNKSFNYFYQGLCYRSLEQANGAKRYLTRAARFSDEFGSRAAFELGVVAFRQGQKRQAGQWLSYYVQRFPNGIYAERSRAMLRALETGQALPEENGVAKPDLEKALYEYDKYSLFPFPHFWLMQAGWGLFAREFQSPTQEGGLKLTEDQSHALVFRGGVGFGPFRSEQGMTWGGYLYRQNWFTDQRRIEVYTEDPGNFEYQPFRLDLMQRHHQFFLDGRKNIANHFFLGAHGRVDWTLIGSRLGGTEDEGEEASQVLPVSFTTLFIPWVGLSYLDYFRTMFYLYFRREVFDDDEDLSNQTFVFEGDFLPSMGLSQTFELPNQAISAQVDLFRYEFVYNDYFLDKTREGFLFTLASGGIPNIEARLAGGYYHDVYTLPLLRTGSCTTNVRGLTPEELKDADREARRCEREDVGILAEASLGWDISRHYRISVKYLFAQNSNDTQREFDETDHVVRVDITMAFPSARRMLHLIDRLGDIAFINEYEK